MYDEDPYKVCPECGSEFQWTVATCVDCDVPLVHPEEIATRNARELPLSPALTRLCTAPILWVRKLAADLAYAGIPYAVDRREAREEGVLSIHVRPRDRAAAREAEAARRRTDPVPGEDDPLSAGSVEVQTYDSAPDFKVCPECGGEFRRDIERCADCGVGLVEPSLAEASDAEEVPDDIAEEAEVRSEFPSPPLHQIPASDDLVCFFCGPFNILAGLSAALDAAAIGHRIERGPYERSDTHACLYLEAKDCAMAERIAESPDAAREDAEAGRKCPACNSALPPGAKECWGCGLEFYNPEVRCRRCGAIVSYGGKRCPNCGTRLDAS
jgi:predicted amidophosphoribosyltransferase